MQLILALPALFEARADKGAALHAPALAHLLAMAGMPTREDGGIAAALAARFGVMRQTDWPLAPIRIKALGVDPETAYWVTADPVTLEVGHSNVQLAGVVDDLGRADADALIATLNTHFANDDFAFVAPRPDAFFVRVAARTRLSTRPLGAVMHRPLRPLLPQGDDAAVWRRWQSEIEMLLHEHPVNVERERAGLAPANSLWFSEGGTLATRQLRTPTIATFATTGIARALATWAGSPLHAMPGRLRDVLNSAGEVEAIVVTFDRALEVSALERAWAAPARDALVAGSLHEVTLVGEDEGDAIVWNARVPGWWQRIAERYRPHDLGALLDAAKDSH